MVQQRKPYRFNELQQEHGELHFINDFAEIREVKNLDQDNEPMLRVYRASPGALNLQIRTFGPINDRLARTTGKKRNMIATVKIELDDLETILKYGRDQLLPREERLVPQDQTSAIAEGAALDDSQGPAPAQATGAMYRCVKCRVEFQAMTPRDARLATGRGVEHCGEPAQWIGNTFDGVKK